MEAGARQTLTESTSSSDGAEPSGALRTRNCNVSAPGAVTACSRCSHPVEAYEPCSRSDALKSVATAPPGDVSVTSLWSSATDASSMPTQRTSYEMVAASGAVTLNDSVVKTPARPAVSTAMCPDVMGVSDSPIALDTDDCTVTRAASDATYGASAPPSKSLSEHLTTPGWVGRGVSDGVPVGAGVLGGDSVAVRLSLGVPDGEPVPLALGVPAPVADDEPDAVALCEGVGRTMATTRLSTSSDELPVDMPPALTTDSRSTTDAAGGSVADRRTQPERPKVPTCATLTLYSTVVVAWPAASVATAATCAESLRKSRDTKKTSNETAISAGASSASDRLVGSSAAPAVSDTR
jgi:hypothetical protein